MTMTACELSRAISSIMRGLSDDGRTPSDLKLEDKIYSSLSSWEAVDALTKFYSDPLRIDRIPHLLLYYHLGVAAGALMGLNAELSPSDDSMMSQISARYRDKDVAISRERLVIDIHFIIGLLHSILWRHHKQEKPF